MSRKTRSQNALRTHLEILPHQKRPILSYLEPPISHIGKKSFLAYFHIFQNYLPKQHPVEFLLKTCGFFLQTVTGLVSFNRSDLIAEQGSNRSQNCPKSQHFESTLSSPEVVPHLAPKKFETKLFSEWVANVSRNTPTSKTTHSELSRASHLPYG